MTDMLVKLYDLPAYYPVYNDLMAKGVEIRPPFASEKRILVPWIQAHFEDIWAAECAAVLDRDPINCFIAIEKQPIPAPDDNPYNLAPEKLLGFACFDVAKKGMFGPMAVLESCRERGIGKGLLLASLHAMKAQNYAYAVIWWAGPTEFYAKAVGATGERFRYRQARIGVGHMHDFHGYIGGHRGEEVQARGERIPLFIRGRRQLGRIQVQDPRDLHIVGAVERVHIAVYIFNETGEEDRMRAVLVEAVVKFIRQGGQVIHIAHVPAPFGDGRPARGRRCAQ